MCFLSFFVPVSYKGESDSQKLVRCNQPQMGICLWSKKHYRSNCCCINIYLPIYTRVTYLSNLCPFLLFTNCSSIHGFHSPSFKCIFFKCFPFLTVDWLVKFPAEDCRSHDSWLSSSPPHPSQVLFSTVAKIWITHFSPIKQGHCENLVTFLQAQS